ncbi:MAG: glycoside hydrolase N-terminal domain-containing protein, partial [Oscillospiraceae bacterium]
MDKKGWLMMSGKVWKRCLALVLTATMLLGALPVTAADLAADIGLVEPAAEPAVALPGGTMAQARAGAETLPDAEGYGPDSGTHPTFPSSGNGAAGNDADPSTKWTAETAGSGQYWMEDAERQLHLYKLKLDFDAVPFPYKVEVAPEKSGPWTLLAEYTAETVNTRPYEEDLGGARGRYLKVTFTDVPSDSCAFLNEATLYGIADDEQGEHGYATDSVYVSDLTPTKPITQGWLGQEVVMDQSIEHKPITVAGTVYAKGLGLHADSEAVYDLAGKYTRFRSVIGIDSEAPNGDAIFRVYGTVKGTEKLLFEQQMTGGHAAQVDISVRGVTTLRLVTDKNGSESQDHTDWADAQLLGAYRNSSKGDFPISAAVAGNSSALVAEQTLRLSLTLKNSGPARKYQAALGLYGPDGALVKLVQTQSAILEQNAQTAAGIAMEIPAALPLGSELRLNVYDGETLELLAQTVHYGVKTPGAGTEPARYGSLLAAMNGVLNLVESGTAPDYNPLGIARLREDFGAAYALYRSAAPTEEALLAAQQKLDASLAALVPAIDTAALAAAVERAVATKTDVVAAEGPAENVVMGIRFVSPSQLQTFAEAIAKATQALGTVSTIGEMQAEADALIAATEVFAAAIQTGTKEVLCTITFQSNGGTPCPPLTDVMAGSTIALPEISREYHRFDGWYTDAGCTRKFASEQKITGDLTLYAKWVLNWENSLTLFYEQPASRTSHVSLGESDKGLVNPARDQPWQQTTLPIGSGDLGANIYGEIGKEHLTFNEKTLWTGGPSSARPNYRGGNISAASGGKQMFEVYKEIQNEFAKHTTSGDRAAHNLCNQLVGVNGDWNSAHTLYGGGYGSYQPWGDVYLDFGASGAVTNYRRWLDLNSSLAGVYFTKDNTAYQREYLASNPDKVIAMKLTAVGTGKLNFTLSFEDAHNVAGTNGNTAIDPSVVATAADGVYQITLKGALTDNQLRYNSQMILKNEGGTVSVSGGDKLTVAGAGEVTIFLTAATDYKQDYPVYRTGETAAELHARVAAVAAAAAQKGYEKVKADHVADYKSLFDRVTLNLGQGKQEKPTDAMLSDYKADRLTPEEKRILEVNLFQYGRYLTISSSRQDSQLPANLQGVWANQLAHLWGSDYHMNVNLQMNYWPTYSTNLAECADPLIRYVDGLREPGRVTAADYVGVVSDPAKGEENGFMAHTQNNPFGWTCPGWDFSWGWSPAAVPWILQNCWEQYEFTGDLDYMKKNIYPMLKEEAKLYDSMLIWDETQLRWVLSPTYSPEHGPRTVGNTYEQTLAWQLYNDAIIAAGLVGETDKALVAGWETRRDGLNPIQIGTDGQIKEWYEETTLNTMPGNEGNGHRHLSHMLGLFPGDLIATKSEWLEAARVSMSNRTDTSTGWGMGQRINTWARLGDGNKAYKLVGDLFKNGIYPNMWDAHPPFQIDGNFGYTSGVSEMLVQSNMGFVNLLPALPDAWSTGAVRGLIARGNFELSMDWSEGKLTTATILSKNGGDCTLGYTGISLATITDSKGKPAEFTVAGNDRITLKTTKGETYTVAKILEPLAVPTGLAAERTDEETVNLRWDPVAEATRYAVYRQVDSGTYALLTMTAEPAFTDPDACEALGNYHYQVAAADTVRRSNPTAAVVPAISPEKVPTGISVTAPDGLTTLSKSGSTLRLAAAIAPETASRSLLWSVSDETLASVSTDGLVRIKDQSGTVTVTAAAASDGTVAGSITLTIALSSEKEALQTLVESHCRKAPYAYTSATYAPFHLALEAAIATLNKSDASGDDVTNAENLLAEKAAALVAVEVPAPTIPANVAVSAKAVQSDRLTLVWSAIDKTDHYEVTWQDEGEAASLAVGVPIGTREPKLLVEGLEAGRSYTFRIVAVSASNHTAELPSVSATTKTSAQAPLPKVPYQISVAPMTHGTVVPGKSAATAGTTVSLTISPESGYRLQVGSLYYNEILIEGTSFVMPEGPVTLKAAFEPVPVDPPDPP